ncbi:PLP-dependent aminotransferase family protein [Metabacillus fastidiosus]|uniref:MocR-like pyridoxine biosynthesis transcription factor PdxR n=1 Tax=Metabacillus fastidiosus TaxID=1458 RepID=UPI002DB77210|nr:PLP-dependent aminotransferase family protein [Metabacillus fastidiosus]MEC2078491.1 PLP-dependent aminotransferase family protein [Metabacillus fastidiosus]
MMKLSLSRESRDSLSEQIFQQITSRIHSNMLTSGEKLPSVRQLSADTGVSLLTVHKAYKRLEAAGVVQSIHGKGVFVKAVLNEEPAMSSYDWQLSIPTYLTRSSFHSRPKTKYRFDYSALNSGLLPTIYLADQLKQMLEAESSILGTYGDVQGDFLTREAFSAYFQNELGLSGSPDNIIMTTGLHQGIELIAKTLLGPGDVIITEAPTYPGALDIFINRGAKVIPITMDEEGIRTDLLAQVARAYHPKAIYVNPTFQNPTGRSMSMERRQELLYQAQLHGMFIIEDDSWSELYFDEKPPPKPIKSLDDEGRVLFLKGFSKALAPGIRIGAILAEGSFKQSLLSAKSSSDLGTPLLTQRAVLPFLTSTRMLEHFEKLRLALELRRDKTIAILETSFDSSISWSVPEGGLNIWLTFPENVSTLDLYEYCLQHDVSFLPGHACYPYEPPYNHLRLTYSILNEHDLEEGLKTFAALTNAFLKQKI